MDNMVQDTETILEEMFPEIKGIWSLCPGRRQKKTAREWVAREKIRDIRTYASSWR